MVTPIGNASAKVLSLSRLYALIPRGSGSETCRCSYCPAASRYLATTSAGTRPRSLMSMPWSLAQARTAWVSMALAFRRAPRLTPAGAADLTGMGDVCLQRGAQFLAVRSVQVDLIVGAVQAKADGALGVTAVNVVDVKGLHLLGHEHIPFL